MYTLQNRHLRPLFMRLYRGRAVEAFKSYLTANCKRFADGEPKTNLSYCAKYCSIVQSSGTGKSRLITEVREALPMASTKHMISP